MTQEPLTSVFAVGSKPAGFFMILYEKEVIVHVYSMICHCEVTFHYCDSGITFHHAIVKSNSITVIVMLACFPSWAFSTNTQDWISVVGTNW